MLVSAVKVSSFRPFFLYWDRPTTGITACFVRFFSGPGWQKGRWVAKIGPRIIAMAGLWVRVLTISKKSTERQSHKSSGHHTPAHKKSFGCFHHFVWEASNVDSCDYGWTTVGNQWKSSLNNFLRVGWGDVGGGLQVCRRGQKVQ